MDVIRTRQLEPVEGFEITAHLVPDLESDDTAAPYGVVVIASKAGIELGSDSLWMTDAEGFDYGEGDEFVHGYGPDLIAEAIASAKDKLAELGEV